MFYISRSFHRKVVEQMDENEMRQTKNGIRLLGDMLDLIENGDCIEDLNCPTLCVMQFQQ